MAAPLLPTDELALGAEDGSLGESSKKSRAALPARTPAEEARLRGMVRAHHSLIWRVVRRLGVTDADSDDAVQEVFWVAAGRLSDIEEGKERAFLYSTAARVAANVRRSGRRRQNAYDNFGEAPTEGVRQPDELSDQRRARAVLDEILDTLPDEMREVLVLFEMQELSIQEIAEALELPTGTVGSRLRRAREKFQAAVERRRVQAAFRRGAGT
jgi:RNA polymerase sigma-70 factor, ECF subfamily